MSRIPYPAPDQLSPAKRAFATTPGMRMLNIIRMAMWTPDGMWEKQRDFSVTAVGPTLIGPRLREILVLRVGALSNSDYELHHHRSLARNQGIDDATIRAVETGDFATLGEKESIVAQFTSEVVEKVAPSDEIVKAARAHFSDPAIFEMVALIGIYMMNARIIGVGGLELDGHAVESWDKDKITG